MKSTTPFFKFSFLVLLTPLFFLGCGGNLQSMAQGYLYAAATANKTAVPAQPPEGYGQDYLQVSSGSSAMKIHLWYWTETQNPQAPVILHLHGNAENIGSLYTSHFLAKMETLGAHFVVVDYPGYGKSTGPLTQESVLASANAALLWTHKKFPQSPVIVWGWSLGSAVTAQVVLQNQTIIKAFVMDSAWTSVRKLAKEIFGGLASQLSESWYQKNEWDSYAAAPQIHIPGLMHHGSKDNLIPWSFGKDLSEQFPKGLVTFTTIAGKGHGDIFAVPEYWTELKSFIDQNR